MEPEFAANARRAVLRPQKPAQCAEPLGSCLIEVSLALGEAAMLLPLQTAETPCSLAMCLKNDARAFASRHYCGAGTSVLSIIQVTGGSRELE
jgi:hypothetical protein